jgi:hypothetical protein
MSGLNGARKYQLGDIHQAIQHNHESLDHAMEKIALEIQSNTSAIKSNTQAIQGLAVSITEHKKTTENKIDIRLVFYIVTIIVGGTACIRFIDFFLPK